MIRQIATGRFTAYTIAAASIATPDLPSELMKSLPAIRTLPAVRIGRLAVDSKFHGHGLGAALLADAVRRTLQAPSPAVYTLPVDAKSDEASAFYQRHGFRPLASQPRLCSFRWGQPKRCPNGA